MEEIRLCILNQNRIIPTYGGVERVVSLLLAYFKSKGIYVCVYYFKQVTSACEQQDYEIMSPYSDVQDDNFNLIAQHFISTLKEHRISVILNVSNIVAHMDLCYEAKEVIQCKLIYAFHRDPLASLKEYDDFVDKKLYASQNYLSLMAQRIYWMLKRPFFIVAQKNKNRKEFSSFDLNLIDEFVCLSGETCTYFQSLYEKTKHKKFIVIPNPSLVKNEISAIKKKQVLFVARMTYQKRLDRLLRIWEKVEKLENEWTLLVLGDGPFMMEYKRLAVELGLNNVRFLGNVNPITYYQESQILCMTSSHEGYPMVLVEALQYGCIPILYDSFSSAKEMVIDKVNGFLVKPFSKKKYLKKLLFMMKNPTALEKARMHSQDNLWLTSIDKVGEQWISLFKS